jgi:hypothetical protein
MDKIRHITLNKTYHLFILLGVFEITITVMHLFNSGIHVILLSTLCNYKQQNTYNL